MNRRAVTYIYDLSIMKHSGAIEMKRSLIASAVLTASFAAWAQSPVTIYGAADVGVGKNAGNKVQMMGNNIVNNSSSYLGFRGFEDLGGGLKAGFVLEQGINLENGNADTNSEYGSLIPRTVFQRGANVWLGGNWGSIRLGRAYTPSRNAVAAWSIVDMANYSASVITFGAVGGNSTERGSSQFIYKTPVFGDGFSAELAYVAKADNDNRSKIDMGLMYANGPLNAGISYNKEKDRKANYAIGAKYTFGNFALSAGYHASQNTALANASGQVVSGVFSHMKGVTLGGAMNLGAANLAIEVARPTRIQYEYNGVTYHPKKYTNVTLAGKYALSKRTFFYADYLRLNGQNNYGLGLQHRF